MRFLLIFAWLVPAFIVVLGLNVGATIWYYMEPQMGILPDPGTYYVAVFAGFIALLLSLVAAMGISIHVGLSRPHVNANVASSDR
ncbi:hypothetical protein I6E52_02175 [Salinibacterium sp. NG253]|uniref:hypothetical protein n=1 Tax=Salinibacterium sp. NG253 TaxID=2792039 RepID=UPI0018CF4359|nr:hypothetical protein [Salinibacterium sp. NG253]MBH0115648.1 hypothetical protein [Salinibacterium sp. NG253]